VSERSGPPEDARGRAEERSGPPLEVRAGREFERRVDRAHRAATMDDLRDLLDDLPGGAGALLERAAGEADPEDAPAGLPERVRSRVPADRVGERSTVIAVMGGNVRKGRWVPSRQINCVALMGGVELDFREALMGPGVTEVNVFTVCGGAEIVVPPGLRVESSGMAVMGAFENAEDHPADADAEGPLLRIHGLAILGAVEISSRYPGESVRDAKRRRKELRRARRKRLRGE